MATVWIAADGAVDEQGQFVPADAQYLPGITALQQAIAALSCPADDHWTIRVVSVEAIASHPSTSNDIICPLSLHLPETCSFPGQAIYRLCRDIENLRQKVQVHLGGLTGTGNFWLPIALTAKGPLYAEVIGVRDANTGSDTGQTQYIQPIHLSDRWRQPLYRFGRQLLQLLAAPPSVYLVQFGFQGEHLCFDRLFPFPSVPAIASLGTQTPNLFECYWRCLTRQPILDLTISTSAYQPYEPESVYPSSD